MSSNDLVKLRLACFQDGDGPLAQRRVILPKSKATAYILGNDSSMAFLTLAGSTVSSVYYRRPSVTTAAGARGALGRSAAEPVVVFVPLSVIPSTVHNFKLTLVPNAELDTVCKLFNDKIFPKQRNGTRRNPVWRGQGLCSVVNNTVNAYGLKVEWQSPPAMLPVSASDRNSASPPTGVRPPLRRQRTGSDTASTVCSSAERGAVPPAKRRRGSATLSTANLRLSPSRQNSSSSSALSVASVSSLAARPAKLSNVFFTIKRFGLWHDLLPKAGFCRFHAANPNASGEAFIPGQPFRCLSCSSTEVYRGSLGFEVTAMHAQGQILDLEPLVAENVVEGALAAGLQSMLESYVLTINADEDSYGRVKSLKSKTGKWARKP